MAKNILQEEKIKSILGAVRKLLAQNGYPGTTISLVAQEAGVSRGILHYYFKNKEEMLIKVIQEDMDLCNQMIAAVFAMSNSVEDLAETFVSSFRGILKNDPDFFNVFFEGWSAANQSTTVNEVVRKLYKDFRDAIQTGLQGAVERGIISPSIPLPGLASILTATIDGLGLQMVTEEELGQNEEIWSSVKKSMILLCSN